MSDSSNKDLLGLEFKDEKSPFDIEEKKKPDIRPVPPSALLQKARMFLPEMKAANEDLEQRIQRGEQVRHCFFSSLGGY